jgi:hypothetical protein
MTNRYPLIIDTADGNKIKELPAGDNLNLLNNSILGVQDITALGTIDAAIIRVAGQRILAQTFTDLSDTPNNYTSAASSFVKVNSAGTALEFAALSSLGDITVGNVTVGSGNIVPAVDNTRQLGTTAKKFTQIHAVDVYSNLRGRDGSLVFDASNNRIPYAAIFGAPTALSELTNDMGFVDSAGIGDAIDSYLSDSTNTVANKLVNGAHTVSLGSDGVLTLPNGSTIGDGLAGVGVPITTARGTILLGNLAECEGGESHFHIMKAGQQAIDLFLGDDSNYVKLPSTGGVEISSSEIGAQHYWTFGATGALVYPNNALQRDTATVSCLGNASTVVYTGSASDQTTIKLLIQVEGNVGAAVDWDTQSCEMIIAKSWRVDDVAATVYAVVHTSVAPLATFSAEWNALTSRVEVLCATPSANTVYVRTFATEITTAD